MYLNCFTFRERIKWSPCCMRQWDKTIRHGIWWIFYSSYVIDRSWRMFHQQLTVENQRDRSLVAQRGIVDHVRLVWGTIMVEITKELLRLAVGARYCRYCAVLLSRRKRKSSMLLTWRERPSQMSLMIWKRRGLGWRLTFAPLKKSVDEYAEKAEATCKLTFIVTSSNISWMAEKKWKAWKGKDVPLRYRRHRWLKNPCIL